MRFRIRRLLITSSTPRKRFRHCHFVREKGTFTIILPFSVAFLWGNIKYLWLIPSGIWGEFSLTDVEMTVPIGEEMMELIKHSPLVRLRLNGTQYHLIDPQSWMTIDEQTGDIFLTDGFRKVEPSRKYSFSISAHNTTTKITINPKKIPTLEGFCSKSGELFCFWDSVTYRIPESTKLSGKVEEIGPVSSEFLKKFCPNVVVKHKLINGSEFFDIREGVLRRISLLDHDTLNPGPNIFPEVECRVTTMPREPTQTFRRTLRVEIVDRNDNPPQRQDDHRITIDIGDPHFIKVSFFQRKKAPTLSLEFN